MRNGGTIRDDRRTHFGTDPGTATHQDAVSGHLRCNRN